MKHFFLSITIVALVLLSPHVVAINTSSASECAYHICFSNISSPSYSHSNNAGMAWADYCAQKAPNRQLISTDELLQMSRDQLEDHFTLHGSSQDVILDHPTLYMSDAFVALVKDYPGYGDYLQKVLVIIEKKWTITRALECISGEYIPGLERRLQELSRDHEDKKACITRKKEALEEKRIRDYELQKVQVQELYELHDDWQDEVAYCDDAGLQRWENRIEALDQLKNGHEEIRCISYHVSEGALLHLRGAHYDPQFFTAFNGNYYQHILHKESIAIIEKTTALNAQNPVHDHQEALIDWAVSAREYNGAGLIAHSTRVLDFCWALLDYGKAVVEGVIGGAAGAVQDCIDHPINTAACIIMPQGVLVYQLSKVLVNVANIGVTYLCDKENGQRKLHDYIAPLTHIIDAITNKQLHGPDIVRRVTQFAVCWKAQSKLLGGLSKFYGNAKTKLERFIKENPLAEPELYITTPEGMLLKYALKGNKVSHNNSSAKFLKRCSRKYWIKKYQLPTKGKIRYVPPKNWYPTQDLPFERLSHNKIGFIDNFGNRWVQGKSRTAGQPFEWDVQLSSQGKLQLGWMTRDNSHLNVSLDGRVTHK